jgi:hypothetical protein
MDIEYATTGIQPEVSFIMQLMDEDADRSSSSESENSDRYVGEGSDTEEPRVRVQREHMQKRASVDKKRHGIDRSVRYMRDHDVQVREIEWSKN